MQRTHLQAILAMGLSSYLLLKRAAQPRVEKLQRYHSQYQCQPEATK